MEKNKGKRKASGRRKRQKLEKLAQECCELIENKEKLDSSSLESDSTSSSISTENENLYLSVATSECSTSDDESSVSEEDLVIEQPESPETKNIQAWVVDNNIPHRYVDKLLPILKKRLLPDIPKCTKTLLKCDFTLENVEKMEATDGTMGEFVYLGLQNSLKKKVNVTLHSEDLLELIINIDRFSPFKSSVVTIWPILCKVYTESDIYKPFIVAVYSGSGKPKNCTIYLTRFVKELNVILKSGIEIENRHFRIKIKYFVCDSPARVFLKCIVGHTVFHACERWRVIGEKVNKVTVFLQTDATKKSDMSFKTFEDAQCHIGILPLSAIEPCVNMVSHFVLDPMPLVYLGCTKRLLEYLLSSSSHKVRLSGILKCELVRRTKRIYQDIPAEFPRKMCSTDQ